MIEGYAKGIVVIDNNEGITVEAELDLTKEYTPMGVKDILIAEAKKKNIGSNFIVTSFSMGTYEVKITHEKMVTKYINAGGNICPFCWGNEIRKHELDGCHGSVFQDCTCLSCHKMWTDEYTLYNITLEEEDNA